LLCRKLGNVVNLFSVARNWFALAKIRTILAISLGILLGGIFIARQEACALPAKDTTRLAATGDATQDSQLTVDDIVEKALTAYGGRSRLAEFASDASITGELTQAKQASAPSLYKYVRKYGRWRVDVESANASSGDKLVHTTGFDGTDCWESGAQGASYLSPGQSKWLTERERRRPFILTTWNESGYRFQLLGPTSYKHIPVFGIEVTHGDDSPTTLFLDRANYLVVAATYQLNDPDLGKAVTLAFEYEENRPAQGVIWPFKQTEFIDNQQVAQSKVISCGRADNLPSDFFNKAGEKEVRLAKPITVPFDYGQKEIVCKGKIEGNDNLVFLFDTGSSETIIDRRVAALLFLTKGPDFKIAAFGGDLSAQTTKIDRLELGNLIINNVKARLLDLSPQSRQLGKTLAGIIGMNVISNYLVTIDYGKPALTFADASNSPRPANLNEVSFSQTTAPLVKVALGGNDSQDLLMDTGAAFNHLPWAIAQRYIGKDKTQAKHFTEGTGLDGKAMQLGLVTINPVSIGSQSVHKVSFTYPASQGKSPGSDGSPATTAGTSLGILGNPFWQNFIVTIDSRFQRLILKVNALGAVRSEMENAINAGDQALVTQRDFRNSEFSYQKALIMANNSQELRFQAIAQGRLGNLRRIMAHDLQRPEHARAAYNYFSKADEIARKADLKDVEGRILADWSLLYSDNGQFAEAKQTVDKALSLAPQDATVNLDNAVHLFRNRYFPEAAKYIDKALILDPGNWQALWYQVKLSETFADQNKEKETLSEILKYYPWSKVAQAKLKALTPPVPGKPNANP
jgi:tetratricopeptide (TPR) repeat protein